jgi:hypothetical protein
MKQGTGPEDVGLSAPGGGLGAILRNAAGKPELFFHGTKRPYVEPDFSKADPQALFGPGYYHTNNPKVAEGYAGTPDIAGEWPARYAADAKFWADMAASYRKSLADPFFRQAQPPVVASMREAGQRASDKAAEFQQMVEAARTMGPNIRPAYLDIKKPFDMDASRFGPGGLSSKDLRRWGVLYRTDDILTNEQAYRALLGAVGGNAAAVNKILKSYGYDGIIHTGGARTGTTPHQVGIAWDPRQILSPWKVPQ